MNYDRGRSPSAHSFLFFYSFIIHLLVTRFAQYSVYHEQKTHKTYHGSNFNTSRTKNIRFKVCRGRHRTGHQDKTDNHHRHCNGKQDKVSFIESKFLVTDLIIYDLIVYNLTSLKTSLVPLLMYKL